MSEKMPLRCLLTCFVVVFLVVECQSQSYLPWQFGYCTVPPVVQNFNASAFFNGKWYQQSSYGNFLTQGDGICPTIDSEITTNGDILQLYYQYERISQTYTTLEGTGRQSDIKNGIGYLPITYRILSGLIPYEAPMYIVGTDYENWAVMFSCKQQLFLKLEMSWTLTRSRDGTAQADIIKTTLEDAGLDLSRYVNSTNVGCGFDEPGF